MGTPKLLVVVDTEEAFDWSKPHSRSHTNVGHIARQDRAQTIFERYGIQPTYVVDYPVASQEKGYKPLRDWLAGGKCQIGTHLHPWVNPPFDEELCARNSYPGNLPAALEREKLERLTRVIEENFHARPTIYKAGRYGIGASTASILDALGYEIDTSVVPLTSFCTDGGPDFTDFNVDPFWLSERVLEIPLTVSWSGRLGRYGRTLQSQLMSDLGMRLHLPGVFARLRLLERIRLTPEGVSFAELKRLTDAMLADGKRLFVLTYHSPSLVAGNTPYVRDELQLRQFLACIERFCEYFFDICAGVASTPHEVLALHKKQRAERTSR